MNEKLKINKIRTYLDPSAVNERSKLSIVALQPRQRGGVVLGSLAVVHRGEEAGDRARLGCSGGKRPKWR